MDVVVVLPCEPETATPARLRMSHPSDSAYFTQFRVRGADCRGDDDEIHFRAQMLRAVSNGNTDVRLRERVGNLAACGVATGDHAAFALQQLRDTAHTDPADPHQMHALAAP